MTDCGQIELVDSTGGGGSGGGSNDGSNGGGSDDPMEEDDVSEAYADAINIQKDGTSASVEVDVKNEVVSGYGQKLDATVRLERNGTVVGSETINLVSGVIETANMNISLREGDNEICAEVIKTEAV